MTIKVVYSKKIIKLFFRSSYIYIRSVLNRVVLNLFFLIQNCYIEILRTIIELFLLKYLYLYTISAEHSNARLFFFYTKLLFTNGAS